MRHGAGLHGAVQLRLAELALTGRHHLLAAVHSFDRLWLALANDFDGPFEDADLHLRNAAPDVELCADHAQAGLAGGNEERPLLVRMNG